MCLDPVSIMLAGTAISSIGTVAGGFSAFQTGKANASGLRQQAANREEKAKVDIEMADIRQRRDRGTKLASIGGSSVSAESFLDVLNDDLMSASMEKQLIKYGGQVDANNLRFSAGNAEAQGRSALIGSLFSAAGTAAAGYGKSQVAKARYTSASGGYASNGGNFYSGDGDYD